MKIVYDGDVYSRQRAGGINRYFDKLISGLPRDATPVLLSGYRKHEHTGICNPRLKVYSYRRFNFRPGRLSYWLEPYYFRMATALARPNLAHPTYHWFLARRELENYRCPVVLTVYDMIYEIFARELDSNGEEAKRKRKAILAADALICISENTRRDLEYFIPEVRTKCVYVIHLAGGLRAPTLPAPKLGSGRPYFLYVGSRAPYKNFTRLLEAMSVTRQCHPDAVLNVVGNQFTQSELTKIQELRLTTHIRSLGNVSEDSLAALYRDSLALIYPSLYEGFGIPPLEAMTSGAPVIAARASSIPEVVGDSALLFDPYSTDELISCMLQLIESHSLRSHLVESGSKRSAQFSWDKTVEQTWKVYKNTAALSTST